MHFLPKKRLIKSSTLSAKGVLIACSLFTPIALADCNLNAPATTPSSDFIDHNDGTVTHKTTGLMWKVCSEGQTWVASLGGVPASCSAVGDITTHTWDVALQIPETLNAGAGFPSSGVGTPYSNWRLPNLKELQSIAELKCYNPAINETIFPNTASSSYWSSSPYAEGNNETWEVYFSYGVGSIHNRDFSNRVRLVRVGQ